MRQGMYTGLGCGLVLVAGSALAGPPVAGHVDPDAKWVVHVDLEQLNSTQLGSFLMDMVAAETDNFEDIREIMPNFWPGPDGGMFGITLYGAELEFEDDEIPEDFCAVIYGNENIRGLDARGDRAARGVRGSAQETRDPRRPGLVDADGRQRSNLRGSRRGTQRAGRVGGEL